MNKKLKILSVFILAGFSFFYTDKVVKMIRDNDPIMTMIKEKNKELMVTKIDRIIYDDEYLTGVNGCVINEEKSYDRMRVVGEFKQELLVMKEDKENIIVEIIMELNLQLMIILIAILMLEKYS